MRLGQRSFRSALALAGVLACSLVTTAPAVAQPHETPTTAAATWALVDYHQSNCYRSARGGTTYYGIWINGAWKAPIDVGARNLPAGGSYTTSYAPIPPGSSTGKYSLAYVAVKLPPTPVANYTAALWASDGSSDQSVPITLRVQAKCGY